MGEVKKNGKGGAARMWISKRRWIGMKRKIADLEAKAQSQQEIIQKIILALREIGVNIT